MISVADGSLLDYESADQHSITVEVTDAGGLSHSLTTVIGVSFDNSGNDTLSGDDADNVIDGGAGDDVMSGEGGNDQLSGGSGNDTLSGGSGADRFVFDGADQGLDTITDFGTGRRPGLHRPCGLYRRSRGRVRQPDRRRQQDHSPGGRGRRRQRQRVRPGRGAPALRPRSEPLRSGSPRRRRQVQRPGDPERVRLHRAPSGGRLAGDGRVRRSGE